MCNVKGLTHSPQAQLDPCCQGTQSKYSPSKTLMTLYLWNKEWKKKDTLQAYHGRILGLTGRICSFKILHMYFIFLSLLIFFHPCSNFFGLLKLFWGGGVCCCCCCLFVGGYIFYILHSFSHLLRPGLISPRDTNTLLEAEWGQEENSLMWFKSTFISVCQSLPGSLPCPEGEELPLELSCFQQERQNLSIPFPHQIDFQFIEHQRWAVWRQLYQPCCAQNFGNQNSFLQLLMLNNIS